MKYKEQRHNNYPIGPWDLCDGHKWKFIQDSMSNSEYHNDVECTLCGAPGQLDLKVQEVFWPAT